ncbi:hypothetical protein CC80DRAFT_587938 [Byssothecium circinans]|uniref:Uncharacterized protein n=1 Tax=Byssothecium circinans TaxID=147558 RepID=A0A6A5UG05_9PLEO|nr:hypothetical protein CC80DRAFT_587938 [Byssothecium circinans]
MPTSDLFPLEFRIPQDAQERILKWFLDTDASTENSYTDLRPFFSYYTRQFCQALHDNAEHISTKSHKDVLDVARHFKDSVPKEVIRQRLVSQYTGPKTGDVDKLCESSIDLAVRALLMLDVGELQNGFCGRKQILWKHGTVQEFVQEIFPSDPVLSHEGVKFGSKFIAHNLKRIAGIEIQWTTNLADHLRMTDEDRKVNIFHHASFLRCQRHSLFPEGFVDETLRTLKLLFPKGHKDTEKWYCKLAVVEELDHKVPKCGYLRADDRKIEHFKYWHDRLVILKQVFDESRPSTLSQWWKDRRNGVQWYTFWVAILVLILTIFFGLVQSIEGALQVYKAYHPTPS